MINDLLLRTLKLQKTERTPVWIMRQAGRYLPQYRAIRERTTFLELCKTPELAAEVTIQPVDIIGVDAAIIFSDILVIPEAMGMTLELEEKKGPNFPSPLRSLTDINKLHSGISDKLKYVYDAIALVKKNLNDRVPIIGFAGAPFTLATYAIEGKGSKDFSQIKRMMYSDPKILHTLLEKFTIEVSEYLVEQVHAGADIVQIFDTWASVLSIDTFKEFSLPYLKEITRRVKAKVDVPIILFPKAAHHSIEAIAETGADAVSLDWTCDIGTLRERVQGKIALQGNLDPCVLYSSPEKIREEVKKILAKYGNHPGHIFNLGHGILPDVPPENAKAMVDAVKEESTHMRT